MGGEGGSSGTEEERVLEQVIDDFAGKKPAQPGPGATSGAGSQPPGLVDHVAFPDETDAEIADNRAADAHVARMDGPVGQAASDIDLHELEKLDDTGTAYVVVGGRLQASPMLVGASERRKQRRAARLAAVAALCLVAILVIYGAVSSGSKAPTVQATGATPSAQAAGVATANSPAAATPSDGAASASPSSAASAVALASENPGAMEGQFDLASLANGDAAALTLLRQMVTDNDVVLTYEQDTAAPATPAKVHGTFNLTIYMDDQLQWTINVGMGGGSGASAPTIPDTWRGCTSTTVVQGQLVGAQSAVGATTFSGTASVTITTTVQGCERTGQDFRAAAPQDLTDVPWTATGDATGLKGTLSFPKVAGVSAGIAWPFTVQTK